MQINYLQNKSNQAHSKNYYEVSLFICNLLIVIECLYEASSLSLCQFATESGVTANNHVRIKVDQSIAMF